MNLDNKIGIINKYSIESKEKEARTTYFRPDNKNSSTSLYQGRNKKADEQKKIDTI